MRITSSMYYKNIYSANNSKINNQLFDVNKQISSGLKIQYAQDDVSAFTQTMQLDNELVTIKQIKQSTENGHKVSNQTDVVLNEFETSLERTKTLLINAANATQSIDSMDAIAKELRGLEKHFKNLANTSINGKYLFSGSAVSVKPIDNNGTYHGNDAEMNAILSSHVTQKYNLSGADLFLGEEIDVKRVVTTNVINKDLINGGIISEDSTIRDLMGDIDDEKDTVNKNYFYIRGIKSDGTAFKVKKEFDDTANVSDLLKEIGKAYGNNGDTNLVNVRLNTNGQIVIEDKQHGSSKLDFHMVGAVDFDDTGKADKNDIDDLDNGENDYEKVKNDDDGSTNHLFIKEFIKSGFKSASGAATNNTGLVYDRTQFTKKGAELTANVAQIVKETNAFASPSTKISEVADLSQATAGTLDGTTLNLMGKDINGNDYTAKIDFKSSGSTFSVDTNGDGVTDTDYNIYNMQNPRTATDADKVTYQQLMDVVNMVVTNKLPATNTANAYDTAIKDANTKGTTSLTYDGKLQFTDLTTTQTQATLALHDANSDDFTKDPSVMTFNANNSLTIVDPKTDFFKNLDDAISAVEEHKFQPDASSGNERNKGIENGIAIIDKLLMHVSREHASVGAQSNVLTNSLERTSLLEVSTTTLRSSVIDTDIAEASLRLQQLNLNYQAMLSTVGKISKLSLVNYL